MAADNAAKMPLEQSNGDRADTHAQETSPAGESPVAESEHGVTEPHDLTFIRTRRARANDPRRSLNAAFAARSEPPTPVALRRAPVVPPPSASAARSRPLRRGRTFWLLSAALFVLVAGSTFAVFYLRQTSVERASVAPEVIRATIPVSGLHMHVEAQGERVLVSWNPRASGVQAASGGMLTIEDAGQHRELPLDANQAANGSVLYRPLSGDVTFRLQIRNVRGTVFSDSLRVVDPAKAALAKQTKPAVNSNETATRLVTPAASKPPSQSAAASKVKSHKNQAPSMPVSSKTRSPHMPALVAKIRQSRTGPDFAPGSSSSAADPSLNMPETPPTTAPSQVARQIGRQQTARPETGSASSRGPDQVAPPSIPLPRQTTAPAPGNVSVAKGTTAPDAAVDGFVPPQVITQVMPTLRSSLRAVVRPGTKVAVTVKIDNHGHVKHARVIGDVQDVDIGIQKAAIDAAKQWKFEPARLNGKRVNSEHTIIFRFQPAGK